MVGGSSLGLDPGPSGAGGWYGWQRLQPEIGDTDFVDHRGGYPLGRIPSGDRAVVLVFPEWDASGYVTEERQIPSRDRGGEDLLGLMQMLVPGAAHQRGGERLPPGHPGPGRLFQPR